MRFVVDDIATAFTNKYGGAPSDLLSSPCARARKERSALSSVVGDDVRLEKHRMLRYSPSSGDPRIQSTE